MAHRVQWAVPDHLIYSALYGSITMEELAETLQENRDLIEGSPTAAVHVINDTRGVTHTPSLGELIRSIRGYKPHPRTGWVVVVRNANPVLRFISDVGLQVGGLRVRTVPTAAEAIRYLESTDTAIDWSVLDPIVLDSDQRHQAAAVPDLPV